MKALAAAGIALLVVGAVLFIVGVIPRRETHEAKLLGVQLSVTEEKRTVIPALVSGGLMAAGAGLLVYSRLAGRRG